MDDERLIFYDIEVMEYDSLVVFKNIHNEEIGHFWNEGENGFSVLQQEQIGNIINRGVLCGYNNHYYDDYVLTSMLRSKRANDGASSQKAIKATNDRIIRGDKLQFKFSDQVKDSLDCFQQIEVSMPSLKKIEGNLGRSIIESEISFDINRKLTEEEKEIVYKYCSYDVENTIEVYKLRKKSYFETKEELLRMLGDRANTRYNTTTLSAMILIPGNAPPMWKEIKGAEMLTGVPQDVYKMWMESKPGVKQKPIKVDEFGCTITFASGGLHGVRKGTKTFHNVKLLDVGSMYPTIITVLNALGDGTKKYDEIRKTRLQIKKSDPVRANALKLILNSVYGNLNNRYSKLFNPMAAMSVCFYGQAALYDLCGRLDAKGYKVMNINTDGVAFVDTAGIGDEKWKETQKQWEEKWQMYLDLDEFDLWIQKDVNNYIAKQGEHIKVKGGDLNKYIEASVFKNVNARIVHIATAEYLLNKKSIYTTIFENADKPELFQYVISAGGTYLGTCDEEGNLLPQKVNRVFAVKPSIKGARKYYKLRPDGGKVNFPDMSDHLLMWNDDISTIEDFKNMVDVDFYAEVIIKKLEAWRD